MGLFVAMLMLQWPAAHILLEGNFWLGIAFGQCVALGMPALLLAQFASYNWREVFPLTMPPLRTICAVIGITCIITIATEQAISWSKLHWELPALFEDRFAHYLRWGSTEQNILLIFCLAVLPSCIEEGFFRGICYAAFARQYPMEITILASSVFFAFAHGSTIYFPIYFLLGCYLGYIRYRTGSLTAPIIAHAANNIVTIALKNMA